MEQQTSTEYDRVAYPGYTHPQTHPDRMSVVARLFGLEPAPSIACRVLELGCGDATNLLPMAWALPRSEFVGIDLAGTPIQRGKQVCRELGIANMRLIQGDLSEVPSDLGRFDFIIAHGLYSWVSEQVREQLLGVCRSRLAPRGVAFVSYNAFPGFHLRNMLREMMLFHARGVAAPAERVQKAMALVRFLGSSEKTQDEYRAWLRAECERVEDYAQGHLYHDDLAGVNQAFYFCEFAEAARRHSLQYLGEADFFEMSDEALPDPSREFLQQFDADRIQREQYLDFFKCRRFRQTLLCQAEAELFREAKVEKVRNLRVCSTATLAGGSLDLHAGVNCQFHSPKGGKCETDLPSGKAALAILAKIWPASVPFDQLVDGVHQVLAAHRVATDKADPCAEVLSNFLLRLFRGGVVEFRTHEPPLALEVGEHPVVSPVARWQAVHCDFVTTLLHTPLKIEDEIGRTLLTWLDGTVGRQHLLERLWEFLKSRKIAPVGNREEEKARKELESKLTQKLRQLARLGLLVDLTEPCEHPPAQLAI